MASTNKCFAQMNKSPHEVGATKECSVERDVGRSKEQRTLLLPPQSEDHDRSALLTRALAENRGSQGLFFPPEAIDPM